MSAFHPKRTLARFGVAPFRRSIAMPSRRLRPQARGEASATQPSSATQTGLSELPGGRPFRSFNRKASHYLGSGLVDQSQKMTVAARAMAERKTVGHRS